jgi:predicted KAP-like P-loop ATPase
MQHKYKNILKNIKKLSYLLTKNKQKYIMVVEDEK